jgi:hypothetical protein
VDGKPKKLSTTKETSWEKLVYFIMTLMLRQSKDIVEEHTSQQRRRSECFKAIKHVLQPETFWSFVAGEINGVPNCLTGTTTYEQFQNYVKEANHKSVQGHAKLVQKQFVKEDTWDIGLLFDTNVMDFIPNIGIVPIGIVTTDHKKHRLYCDGTLKLDDDSQPINTIVLCEETEAEIRYESALKNHLQDGDYEALTLIETFLFGTAISPVPSTITPSTQTQPEPTLDFSRTN